MLQFKARVRKVLSGVDRTRVHQWISSLIFNTGTNIQFYIDFLVKEGKYDPRYLIQQGYSLSGINAYGDEETTGERLFLTELLAPKVDRSGVFMDVGANVGNYAKLLGEVFPLAIVHSFEPNPVVFDVLKLLQNDRLRCWPFGLAEQEEILELVTYNERIEGSEHGSLVPDLFKGHYKSEEIHRVRVPLRTLDEFCETEGIRFVEFLKLDTEGFELNVLKGSSRMLAEKRIKCIQFEFNTMNVLARVFLRDFYELLGRDFLFYRISRAGLIDMGKYDSANEIFLYQNIVAVRRDMVI
jgi:FkbM family methyltransferase